MSGQESSPTKWVSVPLNLKFNVLFVRGFCLHCESVSIVKEMTELKPWEWDYHRRRQVSKGLALANTSFVKVYKADISTVYLHFDIGFIINSVNLPYPIHTSGCSLQGALCWPKMTLDLAENLWIWLPNSGWGIWLFFHNNCECLFANNKTRRTHQIWKHNTTFSPVLSVLLFSFYLSF